MAAKTPILAVGYVRVSTEEAQEASIQMQVAKQHAYAALKDITLVDIIIDRVSGKVPFAEREGGAKVMAILKAKKATQVIGLKLDRLFRNAANALTQVEEWDRKKIGLHLIDMGGSTIDTTTSSGKLFITMLAGFAEFERACISERTKNVLASKKENGRAWNHAPLGMDLEETGEIDTKTEKPIRVVKVNEGEAALVARINAMHAAGGSLLGIANTLNAEGLTGKTGGRFYASTIKAIVART
jgi:DNA invertase Pin-like site-specific DNA recombinase